MYKQDDNLHKQDNYLYKDVIVEIALHMKDFINLALTCKKYYSYIMENKDFWRRKLLKDYNYLEKDNFKLKSTYVCLSIISDDPQYYYRKSIRKNDYVRQELIENVFDVKFPYIGIISDNPSYFTVLDIINVNEIVPDDILNLSLQGELSLFVHSQAMGIPYIHNARYYLISCMRKKLEKLNLIFKIGDRIEWNGNE